MSHKKNPMSALYFPTELSDVNCAVCLDHPKKPAACTTCRQLFCLDCLSKAQNGCPTCRGEVRLELIGEHRKLFCCDKHDQLLQTFCMECKECICKQCKDHPMHPFCNIDDVRNDLVQTMDQLSKYTQLVDRFEAMDAVTDIPEGLLSEKFLGFRSAMDANVMEIRSVINKVESYTLRELMKNHEEVKQTILKAVKDLNVNKDNEPREVYEFEKFKVEANFAASFLNLYSKTIEDKFGNIWKLGLQPNQGKLFNTACYMAFSIKLVKGCPGRYEIWFESEEPILEFEKVLEFKVSQFPTTFKLPLQNKNIVSMNIEFRIRPENFKYHLNCSKLYKEIVGESSLNRLTELFIDVEVKNESSVSRHLLKDTTGTQWLLLIDAQLHSNIIRHTAVLEHYDGAIGSFDFSINLENIKNARVKNPESLNFRHRFAFGSKYNVGTLLVGECYQFAGPAPAVTAVFKIQIKPSPLETNGVLTLLKSLVLRK